MGLAWRCLLAIFVCAVGLWPRGAWADTVAATASAAASAPAGGDAPAASAPSCNRSYPKLSDLRLREELAHLANERQRLDGEKRFTQEFKADVDAFIAELDRRKVDKRAEAALPLLQNAVGDRAVKGGNATCPALQSQVMQFYQFLPYVQEPRGDASPAMRRRAQQLGSVFEDEHLAAIGAFTASQSPCSAGELESVKTALGAMAQKGGLSGYYDEIVKTHVGRWKDFSAELAASMVKLDAQRGELLACMDTLDTQQVSPRETKDSVIDRVVFPLIIALGLLYVFTRIFPPEVQLSLIRTRTLVEVVGIAFLLITVITLGGAGKLQAESLGTLLGSIATYIFGRQLFGGSRQEDPTRNPPAGGAGSGGGATPPAPAPAPSASGPTAPAGSAALLTQPDSAAPHLSSSGGSAAHVILPSSLGELSSSVIGLAVATVLLTYAGVEPMLTPNAPALIQLRIWLFLGGAAACVGCAAYLIGTRTARASRRAEPAPQAHPRPAPDATRPAQATDAGETPPAHAGTTNGAPPPRSASAAPPGE